MLVSESFVVVPFFKFNLTDDETTRIQVYDIYDIWCTGRINGINERELLTRENNYVTWGGSLVGEEIAAMQ